MNILILSGSPRPDGNTRLLVDAFVQGIGNRHDVEIVNVCDYNINPCSGCNACFADEKHNCVQNDDMQLVYRKAMNADLLVVASPVFFYGISAQLKATIDRFHNPIRDTFRISKMMLFAVGAASLPELFDSIAKQYELCINFFHLEDAGRILVRGMKAKGDIRNSGTLEEAYQLGKNI